MDIDEKLSYSEYQLHWSAACFLLSTVPASAPLAQVVIGFLTVDDRTELVEAMFLDIDRTSVDALLCKLQMYPTVRIHRERSHGDTRSTQENPEPLADHEKDLFRSHLVELDKTGRLTFL